MLGYVTIGANDLVASGTFYDAVLGALGGVRKFTESNWIGWGPASEGADSHSVYVCRPFNKQPASPANGLMLAFPAPSTDAVVAAYDAGLKAGGSDEGKPGPRPADDPASKFFGAYLRDPVGNKICVYFKG